ncbi:MAG: hypothetical protein O3A99_09855 [Proteobacteria bacterium]|nr:hypothetical protein [Pseudomonadota bacterium]
MKNDARQIAMHIAIGALLTIIILKLMGRLRIERYEGGNADSTEAELAQLLLELEGDADKV